MYGPVHVLHHHGGRVLGQRLREHGVALLVGADHLVRPPLVPQLVGADIGHHVDLGRGSRLSAMKKMPSDQGMVLAKDSANEPCGAGNSSTRTWWN